MDATAAVAAAGSARRSTISTAETAVATIPDLAGRTLAALGREGFKPEAFEPFRQAAAALHAPPAVPPLRLADLQASPLDTIVRPFIVKLGEEIGTQFGAYRARHLVLSQQQIETDLGRVSGSPMMRLLAWR